MTTAHIADALDHTSTFGPSDDAALICELVKRLGCDETELLAIGHILEGSIRRQAATSPDDDRAHRRLTESIAQLGDGLESPAGWQDRVLQRIDAGEGLPVYIDIAARITAPDAQLFVLFSGWLTARSRRDPDPRFVPMVEPIVDAIDRAKVSQLTPTLKLRPVD